MVVTRRGLDEIAGCSRAWCAERFEAAVASVGARAVLPGTIELILRTPHASERGCSGEAELRRGYGCVTVFATDVTTPASVVVTMLHELVHLTGEPGHGPEFRRLLVEALFEYTRATPFADPVLVEALMHAADDEVGMGLDEIAAIPVTLFLSGGRSAPLSMFDMTSGFAYATRTLGFARAAKLARDLAVWRWFWRPSWA